MYLKYRFENCLDGLELYRGIVGNVPDFFTDFCLNKSYMNISFLKQVTNIEVQFNLISIVHIMNKIYWLFQSPDSCKLDNFVIYTCTNKTRICEENQ